MKQYVLTPAAGKRLIGKALVSHPGIRSALESGTLVIIAGTTNGYAAEEILSSIGQGQDFDRRRFFRGITLPPSMTASDMCRAPDEAAFRGDVVIIKGVWHQGLSIFDVVNRLQKGDVILKGANAVDLIHERAAILIGHPGAGTIGAALHAVIERNVRLIIPVGLEKRIHGDLDLLAERLNAPNAEGLRLWPVPGQVFTELDAISLLTGARAEMIAGGGVCGAEGAIRISVTGNGDQMLTAESLIKETGTEPPFKL